MGKVSPSLYIDVLNQVQSKVNNGDRKSAKKLLDRFIKEKFSLGSNFRSLVRLVHLYEEQLYSLDTDINDLIDAVNKDSFRRMGFIEKNHINQLKGDALKTIREACDSVEDIGGLFIFDLMGRGQIRLEGLKDET